MAKSYMLAALALIAAVPAVAGERRELGAHQHGRGTLNFAIDGYKIALELEAPGADIAGFEHEAKSEKDKAAIKQAIATLQAPLTLFKLPEAANCKVAEAKVELETGEHGHAHPADDHGHGEPGKAAADKGGDGHGDGHDHDHDHGGNKSDSADATHSAFHAEYLLECASPAEFKSLTLDYFAAFKAAEGLTIEVIAPKGQSKFEATRGNPVVDLSGLL
ncbi:MAG: DUF2796 domain-containing protein [Hyphomonas sp.]|nr:DUF2796 domain-containing protein [Hyphomonas sp.]